MLNKFQAVLPYSRESVCAFVRIIYSTPVASVPFSCLSAAAFLSSPPFLTFRFLFRLPPGNISRQIASVVILGLPDNTTETLFLRFVYHFPSVEMILLAATSVFYFYFEGASRSFQSDCTNSRCENTWKYYCKFKNNWSTRLFYFHSIDLLIYFRLSYFKEWIRMHLLSKIVEIETFLWILFRHSNFPWCWRLKFFLCNNPSRFIVPFSFTRLWELEISTSFYQTNIFCVRCMHIYSQCRFNVR